LADRIAGCPIVPPAPLIIRRAVPHGPARLKGDFFGFFGALKREDFFWVDTKKVRSASSADAKPGDFFGVDPKKRQNGSRRPHCQFVSEEPLRDAVDLSRMLQPLSFHPGVTGRSKSKIRLNARRCLTTVVKLTVKSVTNDG
jgi:hypothetical protein